MELDPASRRGAGATGAENAPARRGRTLEKGAVAALSTLAALAFVNLAAWLALPLLRPPPGSLEYGMDLLTRVYPHRSEEQIRRLLEETWSRVYVYEPFVQFKEGAFAGEYLNIDENGLRATAGDPPWPADPARFNVFVFGGSTVFGYGLADDETIPSQLHARLAAAAACGRPAVYNLARSNYYSSQERILFEQLLVAGHVPDVAIFIDGLNEFFYAEDEPKFTGRLRYLMSESDRELAVRTVMSLPMFDLVRVLRDRSGDRPEEPAAAVEPGEVLGRWRVNRRLIRAAATELGVGTLFVWQPVPVYGYDLGAHLFADDSEPFVPRQELIARGYRLMAQERLDNPALEQDFLWLAQMQEGRREPLYVDRVHYTAGLAGEIAAELAAAVIAGHCPRAPGAPASPPPPRRPAETTP